MNSDYGNLVLRYMETETPRFLFEYNLLRLLNNTKHFSFF